MPLVERDRDLRRRRRRRNKVRQLRARLTAARDGKERERLLRKIRKLSPNVPVPEK